MFNGSNCRLSLGVQLCASLEACGGGETSPDGKSSWRNPGSLRRGVDIEAVSKLGRISFALPGVTESALGPRPGETVFPPAASLHLSDNGGSNSRVLSGKPLSAAQTIVRCEPLSFTRRKETVCEYAQRRKREKPSV